MKYLLNIKLNYLICLYINIYKYKIIIMNNKLMKRIKYNVNLQQIYLPNLHIHGHCLKNLIKRKLKKN